MLRKRDSFATRSTHLVRRLWIVAGAALLLGAGEREQESEMQLQAAVHREIVLGDLKGALDQYRVLLSRAGVPREVAARALFQIGQCQERLGRREEAQASYLRVVREFAREPAAVSARGRLALWERELAGPRNIDFELGAAGKVPPGWFVPALPKDANSYAELRREGCRAKPACAVVMVPATAPSPFAHLMQSFSAEAYRGKTVRLSGWLRLESFEPADRAQMFLAVDHADRQRNSFDKIEGPSRPGEWRHCDFLKSIDEDATFITIGVTSAGRGRVWIEDVSFEVTSR